MHTVKSLLNINMTGGLAQLKKHQPFICRLGHTKDRKECRALICRATPEQLKSIVGVLYNTLKGKIPLNSHQRRHVFKNRLKFRNFINSCCSATRKKKDRVHIKPEGVRKIRRHLSASVNQQGGLFPLLIPLLALAGKAALAGAVTAGTGLAIKKIAGE